MNQWRKGIASWEVGKTLYQSIPFTWLLPEARYRAESHKGKVVIGGPAVTLAKTDGFYDLSWAETPSEVTPYDTLSFHNPLATFTTRGCPNRCKFCAVPKLEGDFRELKSWKHAPVICDNNLLACSRSHFEAVIESLKQFPYSDFNQGLEAKLLKPWHVDLLRGLKPVKIRFAFDDFSEETVVHDAIELCQKNGLKDLGCYCLIGFNDTPEEAKERLELIRSWGVLPNPMRYQPLNSLKKNSHVADGWTELELRRMMRYYSRLSWFPCSYDDFDYLDYADLQGEMAFG
jgi:hypothetical protein